MNEPILYFFNKYKFDSSLISKIITGECFTAVELKNGRIGLCSNTSHKVNPAKIDLKKLQPETIEQRIILNAYYNAVFNYQQEYALEKDVFDFVDFSQYKNMVMIGYFESTYNKFVNAGLKVSVFDIDKTDPALVPLSHELDFVRKADAILMTATTIANNTFFDLVNNTKEGCDIFLTGPSSIMHPDMFNYKNIRAILGSVFNDHDQQVLDAIEKGGCTRDFIRFGRKVVFVKN
jgi:uncharacterized protein (DUF4213/DUF364 family)